MSAVQRNPERWEELVADDALVGLSPEERRELGDLVESGVVLSERPLFERAAGEVAAAAFDAQDEREKMPASLEAKILARMTRALPKPQVVALARPRAAVPWLLVAAAVALAIAGWTREPVARIPPAPPPPEAARTELLATAGTQKVDFAHTADPAATAAGGDVLWHSGLQRGFMRIQGLAPNDPKLAQYQLWIFDAERGDTYPVDGGVFDVVANDRGEVIVPITAKLPVGKVKLFAITVEKPGGVVVSKRERIVLTATPS